ncbi:MAG: substrate-binding domain-containing protein [Thermomicrobiales bacterium]
MSFGTTRSSRRNVMKWGAALGVAASLPAIGGLRGYPALAQGDEAWKTEPDMAKAKEQAQEIITYGIPDDWANYGEVFKGFQASLGITDGKHTDTDMSSLEEITKFDAEKSNPVAMFADIGMLWGKVANERGVVPPYLPPAAEKLPEGYKGNPGGWVATFAGVPAFVVNVDALGGADVPMTWNDLLREDLKGKVGSPGDPRSSGTAQTTFLAWAYANGGDSANLAPGVDFSKKIIQQYNAADASVDLLEKGEIALWMRYDFNCEAAVAALKEKGINAQTVIPGVSIYAPSAVMLNGYNLAKKDAMQAFAEYVLGDEAAAAFAKFGARPIRYVLGQQELPAEATANWLPQDAYKDVKVIEDFSSIDANTIAETWDEEVLGG